MTKKIEKKKMEQIDTITLQLIKELADAAEQIGSRIILLLFSCFFLYLLEMIGITFYSEVWMFLTELPLYQRIAIFSISDMLLLFYVLNPITSFKRRLNIELEKRVNEGKECE